MFFFFLAYFQANSRIFGQPAAKFWAQAVGFGQLVIGGTLCEAVGLDGSPGRLAVFLDGPLGNLGFTFSKA